MTDIFSRTKKLIGEHSFDLLNKSNVLLFGLGGVGSYIAEGLARAGLGNITIVDGDTISPSNINRQLIALHSTINQNKTDACETRMLDINPKIKIKKINNFITPENLEKIDFSNFDFIIDAIDTTKTKLAIIEKAKQNKTKIISCMGTGNKTCPELFKIVDISKTSVCPLARIIRKELSLKSIKNVPVLFSTETPVKNDLSTFPHCYENIPNNIKENNENKILERCSSKNNPPASISTTPSIAGLLIANYVIKELTNYEQN